MESLHRLYEGCRSYRRFQQKPIAKDILQDIVETARTRSSAMNAQPLRYLVVDTPELVEKIQPSLRWAAKLSKEIGMPKKDELPTAFIVVLGPGKTNLFVNIDTGIALDTMAITAWQYGVGSCIIGAVDRTKLAEILPIPENFTISMVFALGYPLHSSTIVTPDDEHGLNYYVDAERNYYVPKRPAKEVITYL